MTTTTSKVAQAVLRDAADRLVEAARTGVPCPPVRDLIGTTDVATAYAVQQLVNNDRIARGARVIGRKIGLTSPAVQQQLGVDRPDFGVLFDDMGYADRDTVPIRGLLQPKVEAEIAFVLGADLVAGPLDAEQVRTAVAHAAAAVEIVDSRVADWKISFADTVADNASSGLFVLGAQRVGLQDFEPRSTQMALSINGQVVSSGDGSACLGDPLEALAWLARTAREFGEPLREGQVVLSGALGPMVAVNPGDEVVADLSGLGRLQFRFAQADAA
jgi:2-keto-4-pentenoate hydratase